MYEKPSKLDIEELCEVIYQANGPRKVGPPSWKIMSQESPVLRSITLLQARAVWNWYQERKAMEDYL